MERVPQSLIDELLAAVNLQELVAEQWPLRKQSDHLFRGVCPFHARSENTLEIDTENNTFACTECEFHGSAIGWLMYHDGMTFRAAVHNLASRTSTDISEWITDADIQAESDKRAELLESIATFYYSTLLKSDDAMRYLDSRGITEDTIERFALGYADADYSAEKLKAAFPKRHRDLWLAGVMIRQSDNSYRPRFRNRILFPMYSPTHQLVGFGGRALDDTLPKYLNSPNSLLFNKRECLYGLQLLDPSALGYEHVVVVEGYIDVLKLNQAGCEAVVGSAGTALTVEHIKIVFHYTDEVVLCFDGDAAGMGAMIKALSTLLSTIDEHQTASVIVLPKGLDPDSYIDSNGVEAWNEQLQNREYFIETLIKHYSEGVDFTSIGETARFAETMKHVIGETNSEHYQSLLKSEVETMIGVELN